MSCEKGNMTNNLGTNLPIVIKDNGFLKLQSFLKHVTLPINLQNQI
jgi:hypothetical protein